MTDDKIEAFLKEVENFELCSEHPKLLALVRCYREANQFYADVENWKMGKLMNIGNGEGQFNKPCKALFIQESKARAAEAKAKEIING